MGVALIIALWNELKIPTLCWVIFGFEVLLKLLDWWLKD